MVVHTFSFWREPRQICFQHFREFCSAELELKKKMISLPLAALVQGTYLDICIEYSSVQKEGVIQALNLKRKIRDQTILIW